MQCKKCKTKTKKLEHDFLPTKHYCLVCKKTMNGTFVNNTNVHEFERW